MTLLEIIVASIFIIGGLSFDLYKHNDDHYVDVKEATLWSIFWIGLSFIFAGFIYYSRGLEASELFITGYVLEKALAVDNLFVFIAIFASFGLYGSSYNGVKHRILYWGIIGAIIFRMIFIGLGSWFASMSDWVLLGFALIILWTVYLMIKGGDEEEVDYSKHWATKIAEKVWPVYHNIDVHQFFIKRYPSSNRFPNKIPEDLGLKMTTYVTPLFLCLLVIEVSDIVFAFDSVPTIIAVVKDPYLVFTASIFAVLGLRSMFFMLDAAKDLLCHLEAAVIAVLIFIAAKIILEVFNIMHISPFQSLSVVMILLFIGVFSSYVWPEKELEK